MCSAQDKQDNPPILELHKFAEIMALIKEEYVEPVKDEELIVNAIKGMVSSLDSYSSYLNEAEYKEIKGSLSGEFDGIGVEIDISIKPSDILILNVIANSPAGRIGIKKNDKIISVNGEHIEGKTKDKAEAMLLGLVGEVVELAILRGDKKEPLILKLKREIIKTESVKYNLITSKLGFLKINSFQGDTKHAVSLAIDNMAKQSRFGKLQGIIIDLRDNPGGLLKAAVGVTDLFIKKGVIVSTDVRGKAKREEEIAHDFDVLDGASIVVLVNGSSASAAEIVTGALQDYQRAVIVGEKTFGKGSVQSVIELEDKKTALKITTSRYFTPKGRSIQARGIVPDIDIVQNKVEAEKINTCFRGLKLQGHTRNEAKDKKRTKERAKLMIALNECVDQDSQLQAALILLKGLAVMQVTKR
ncbi:MAG: S41 family peptidase [Thiotrichaceae bacterium]|nr:S41 family peptidase [Thiotrichaceae bacterium]